jgi:hypothetical protein
MKEIINKLGPAIALVATGLATTALFITGISEGTNPRPLEYREVAIAEARNTKGYIKISGNALASLTADYKETKLNLTLKQNSNLIECESHELRRGLSFPILTNHPNPKRCIETYTALIRNETNNEKVTVKGKVNRGKLEMYEVKIGNKNYVLLNR